LHYTSISFVNSSGCNKIQVQIPVYNWAGLTGSTLWHKDALLIN
jgi:hypothetical protein